MRQLLIEVQRGQGKALLNLAEKYQGANLSQLEGNTKRGAIDLIIAYFPNGQIEQFLEELEDFEELHVTLVPRGVMPLQPPVAEIPDEVLDVQSRSPLEVFLAGLQSIGAWKGFIAYAVAGAVIVWIGLFTNSSFLLVAAMLIAPFAEPAMNVAIATARGDGLLLRKGLVRYLAAIAVTILVTAGLSLILNQELASNAMVESSKVATVSVLLPLIGGAAGALNLLQADRSSLVSGTAVGMLVAAALAPPAGTAGMALALGLWSMVLNCLFLLVLQLAGINIAAATVFRLYGLSQKGARYKRGSKWIFPVTIAITAALLIGLLSYQFTSDPNLQRSSLEQRANAEVQKVINNSDMAKLVKSSVSFTRADVEDQNTLLCLIYVQRSENVIASNKEISDRLTGKIQNHLMRKDFKATPLVNVSVLETPSSFRPQN
ncbi:DUF389 domain-containing protein [Pleurocapsa sp. PCC 7319]|uniref:DUF389 domain-containing protein n=1 Tax=Pleurocapsa sp. PCC 7319 TaxID=118161 RepID=UPI00034826F8|nr:DUF389 domain-containing protein [Pleurocapsa sp. PCC 7319]